MTTQKTKKTTYKKGISKIKKGTRKKTIRNRMKSPQQTRIKFSPKRNSYSKTKQTAKSKVVRKKMSQRSKKQPGFLVRKIENVLNNLKKEQKKCLRFKKHKDRKIYCFVRGLVNRYFKFAIIFLFILTVSGIVILKNEFNKNNLAVLFSDNLQTNLIQNLTNKIKTLKNQLNQKQKCIDQNYWKPLPENVCNYWLYIRENKDCRDKRVSKTMVGIGKKLCCEKIPGNTIRITGEHQNVIPCPGSDIFFDANKIHNSRLVPVKEQCGIGVCLFYPKSGFHVKVDEKGNLATDSQGNYIIEKDCQSSVRKSGCDRQCGGGHRTVTTMHANCIETKTMEMCNIEPCFIESN